MAQKLKTVIIILSSLLTLSGFFCPAITAAATCTNSLGNSSDATSCTCPSGSAHPLDASGNPISDCETIKQAGDCPSGKVDPNDSTQCQDAGDTCNGQTQSRCLSDDPIVHDLNIIVNFLSAGVGIIVTAVIILGGIQYSLAGGNPQHIAAARQRILNGLIALVAFFLIFALLQWLIPGGVFS